MTKKTKLERDFEALSDEQLRVLCEDANETLAPIRRAIATAPEGSFACPRCGATAYWTRRAADWSAACLACKWGAAGMLSVASVAN